MYVDCGKLDLAADCYISALKIRHTRAHQGLARVHFLKNDRVAAYEEMTKLIEKARNNASAYEKRSEYCERELSKDDLQMVTQLDPLRVYPYRYRAAGKINVKCINLSSNCHYLLKILKFSCMVSTDGQPQGERGDSGVDKGDSIQGRPAPATSASCIPRAHRRRLQRTQGLQSCALAGPESSRDARAAQACEQPGTVI